MSKSFGEVYAKRPYRSKEWLERLYVAERMSSSMIAAAERKLSGQYCDPVTIRHWLKKHGIPIRNLKESHKARRRDLLGDSK